MEIQNYKMEGKNKMAFRLIYTDFWEDAKVMEEMTPEDKYFYLYLLTNPHTNMLGIYQILKKQMAFELGYSIESITSLMTRFETHHQLIKYDTETREILIKNFVKYNLKKGGKPIEDCIKKELSTIKNKEFVKEIVDLVPNEKIKQLIKASVFNDLAENDDTLDDTSDDTCHDTLDDTSDDTSTYQNQNQNQNQNHIYIDLSFIDDVIEKVKLTQEDYDKLCLKYSTSVVDKKIIALDNYIANNNKKYRDHYRTLNTWCLKDLKEKETTTSKPQVTSIEGRRNSKVVEFD